MKLLALLTALICVTLAAPLLAFTAAQKPQVGEPALVIVPFWGPDITTVITTADAIEIAPDRAPVGAFVQISSLHDLQRLYEAGALLVVDAKMVLRLCSI